MAVSGHAGDIPGFRRWVRMDLTLGLTDGYGSYGGYTDGK